MSEELERHIAKNQEELIESQRAYIDRLETAYLQLKQKDIHDNGPFYHVATITGMTTPFEPEIRSQMACEILDRIKKGEQG